MRARRVVIVGRKDEDIEPLQRALDSAGWQARACPGPKYRSCPLLAGQDCDLRDWADTAVVFFDARRTPAASLLEARCAARSPAVVVLEGQVDPPRREGEFVVIGALRSAAAIVGSLSEIDMCSVGPLGRPGENVCVDPPFQPGEPG